MSKKDFIPYPKSLTHGLFRLPIMLQRLGLGWLLGFAPLMVMTTRGRKSGMPRFTTVEYRRHGSKLYVVSGFGTRPQWYQNLICDPVVTLKIGRKIYYAQAHPVEDRSEALRALYMFRRILSIMGIAASDGADNESRSGAAVSYYALPDRVHEFTIVRFELRDLTSGLPAVPTERLWVWPALAAVGLLVEAVRRK